MGKVKVWLIVFEFPSFVRRGGGEVVSSKSSMAITLMVFRWYQDSTSPNLSLQRRGTLKEIDFETGPITGGYPRKNPKPLKYYGPFSPTVCG